MQDVSNSLGLDVHRAVLGRPLVEGDQALLVGPSSYRLGPNRQDPDHHRENIRRLALALALGWLAHMSYLQNLLHQTEPLEEHERSDLRGWLETLVSDCDAFGVTPEDVWRMNAIRAKLGDRSDKRGMGE